jgi:hypothetical protein
MAIRHVASTLRDLGLYGHMLRVSNFFTDRISQSSRSFLKQEDCVPVRAVEAATDRSGLTRPVGLARARPMSVGPKPKGGHIVDEHLIAASAVAWGCAVTL